MKEFKGKQKTAKELLKRGGCYAKGGRVVKSDKESAKEDRAEKKEEKEVGKIDGMKKGGRLDKSPRKSKTQVNVIVGAKEKQPVPVPVPVAAGPVGDAGGPPMSGGMPPPGAGPQGPMKRGGTVKKQKRAAGGRINEKDDSVAPGRKIPNEKIDAVKPASSKVPNFEGGSGGGMGRLEKAKDAKKK